MSAALKPSLNEMWGAIVSKDTAGLAKMMDTYRGAQLPVIVHERNPLDWCHDCGAEDKHGMFAIDMRNGREIALCDRCK